MTMPCSATAAERDTDAGTRQPFGGPSHSPVDTDASEAAQAERLADARWMVESAARGGVVVRDGRGMPIDMRLELAYHLIEQDSAISKLIDAVLALPRDAQEVTDCAVCLVDDAVNAVAQARVS